MVKDDFLTYPEFREGLFTLLRDIIKFSASGLFSLDASQFQNMIHSINFSMKHVKPEICDLGLEAMNELLKLVAQEPSVRDQFFQQYFMLIFMDTLKVMTEQTYVSGFQQQATILQIMI